MISLRRCSKLYRATTVYKSNNLKTLLLCVCNQLARNYVGLSHDCIANRCMYKFSTFDVRDVNVKTNETHIQSFEQNIITLNRNINNKSVKLKEVLEIVNSLENNSYNVSQKLGEVLLKCCGKIMYDASRQTRQELTTRVWDLLKKTKCNLTLTHYHTLLRAYIDNDCVVDPNEFLQRMSVNPDSDTHHLLLKVLSNSGDYKSTEKYMAEMTEKRMILTEEMYNMLIYAYATNGNITKVKQIMNLMEEMGIQPTDRTNVQLMFAFAKNGDMEHLTEILRTITVLTPDIMKLVTFSSLLNNGAHIPAILQFMLPIEELDVDVMSTVVQLVHTGHFLDASTIVTHVPIDPACEYTRKSLGLFALKEMIKSNIDQETLLKVTADIATKLDNDNNIWESVFEFLLQMNNKTLALAVLKEMKAKGMPLHSHYCSALFVNAHKNGYETDMHEIVKHIIALDVKVDFKTFIEYFFPYINTTDPVVAVERMKDNGIQCAFIIPPFMMYLLKKQRMQEGLDLCGTFKKKVDCQNFLDLLILNYEVSRNINHCIEFLFKYSTNGHGFARVFVTKFVNRLSFELSDVPNLIAFLKTMKQFKAFMSKDDAIYVTEKLFNINVGNDRLKYISQILDELIPITDMEKLDCGTFIHPKYMNAEQLNLHLYVLKNTGKDVRGVLRRLLMNACKTGTVEHVNNLVKECKSNNFEWSPGMKVSLFDFYTKHAEVDKALSELQKIQSEFPNFRIDNFKILRFVKLLLQRDKIEEAFNVLEEYTCVNRRMNVQLNCIEILSVLAHSNHSGYVERMINILSERCYCTRNSTILRWLVMVPIIRNDIQSAVKEFRKCVKEYKKTPGKQELLTELLKRMESSVLCKQLHKEVYSLIEEVHGKRNAITTLAIALMLCNKINDATFLFKDQRVCADDFLKQLSYLKDDDIVKISLMLLELGTETVKINVEPICNLALNIYNRKNDCKGAMELQQKMRRTGIIPGKTFYKVFNALLLGHKISTSLHIDEILKNQKKNVNTSI